MPSSSASSFLCQYATFAKYAKYAIATAHSIARLLPQCRGNLRHLQVRKKRKHYLNLCTMDSLKLNETEEDAEGMKRKKVTTIK